MINTYKLSQKVQLIILSIILSVNAYALDYTITFTGGGGSSTVGAVLVKNITKNTSVTVPAGGVLNLTDAATSFNLTDANDAQITHSQQNGIATVNISSDLSGPTQLSVFSVDGRQLATFRHNMLQGINSFEIALPTGISIFKVKGNGISYSTKLINQSTSTNTPSIKLIGETPIALNKAQKAPPVIPVISMAYTAGDQIKYKSSSIGYTSIVTEIPTSSANVHFNYTKAMDIDENEYNVVTIGTQIWLVENLKTTKFRNGDLIPNITAANTWGTTTTPAWSDYSNSAANGTKYGHLYNWYAAVDAKNIAPEGWHVPTDAEWTTLTTYVSTHLGTSVNIPKALASTTDWASHLLANALGNNTAINNSTGFSVLPSGYRDGAGASNSITYYSFLWTTLELNATTAWCRWFDYSTTTVIRVNGQKKSGYAIRCVKDTQL